MPGKCQYFYSPVVYIAIPLVFPSRTPWHLPSLPPQSCFQSKHRCWVLDHPPGSYSTFSFYHSILICFHQWAIGSRCWIQLRDVPALPKGAQTEQPPAAWNSSSRKDGYAIAKGFLLLKYVFKSQAHGEKINLKKRLLEVSLEWKARFFLESLTEYKLFQWRSPLCFKNLHLKHVAFWKSFIQSGFKFSTKFRIKYRLLCGKY